MEVSFRRTVVKTTASVGFAPLRALATPPVRGAELEARGSVRGRSGSEESVVFLNFLLPPPLITECLLSHSVQLRLVDFHDTLTLRLV